MVLGYFDINCFAVISKIKRTRQIIFSLIIVSFVLFNVFSFVATVLMVRTMYMYSVYVDHFLPHFQNRQQQSKRKREGEREPSFYFLIICFPWCAYVISCDFFDFLIERMHSIIISESDNVTYSDIKCAFKIWNDGKKCAENRKIEKWYKNIILKSKKRRRYHNSTGYQMI